MDVRAVRRYLEDWYRAELPEVVERELGVREVPRKAVAVVGPRRAGKTFYFFQLLRGARAGSLYLNFEDPLLVSVRGADILDVVNLYAEVAGERVRRVFLDEVQNLDGWVVAVRGLLDRGYSVFLTGSSSRLLPREVATQLRGRTLTYYLLPFSFREYLRARGFRLPGVLSQEEKALLRRELQRYVDYGGYPEVVLMPELADRLLREYAEAVFYKDFVERHGVRDVGLARYVYHFVLQNFARELSVRRIVDWVKSQGLRFDRNKVYEYVAGLQDTMAVFFLRRYSEKVSLRESWPRKVYVCDTGLTRLFRRGEEVGRLLENVVFLELLRRSNENPLWDIYYFRDQRQREVDFVVKEGPRVIQLIQVTYASSPDELERRELESLVKASEALRCGDLLLLTWDLEGELVRDGKRIRAVPLWRWLLQRASPPASKS
jgi:predicted AAA+ superfamily ATPase